MIPGHCSIDWNNSSTFNLLYMCSTKSETCLVHMMSHVMSHVISHMMGHVTNQMMIHLMHHMMNHVMNHVMSDMMSHMIELRDDSSNMMSHHPQCDCPNLV